MKKIEDFTEAEILDLTGDGSFSVKERVRISVMTQAAKEWPTYDGGQLVRRDFVSASEASRCVRELAFNKAQEAATTAIEDFWDQMGDDEFKAHLLNMGNDDMRGIFERGNWIEEYIVQHLRAMEQPHERFLCLGSEQRSFYTKKRKVSGTPDGVTVDLNKMTYRVLEIKSSQNPMTSPRDSHRTQLNTNAGLIQFLAADGFLDDPFMDALGVRFSDLKFEGLNLIYCHTDNWLDLVEFKDDALPYDNGEAFARAGEKARKLWYKNVETGKIEMYHPSKVPPEGLRSWNGCMFCKHKKACFLLEQAADDAETTARLRGIIAQSEGETKELPKMPTFKADSPREKIAETARSYDAERAIESAAKKRKEALKDALKEWAKAQDGGVGEIVDDGVKIKVSVSESERSGGWDGEKVEALITVMEGKVEDFQKPSYSQETFNVTVKQTSPDQ